VTKRFVGSYKVKAIIRICRYTSQVKRQQKKAPQPIVIEGEEEWEV